MAGLSSAHQASQLQRASNFDLGFILKCEPSVHQEPQAQELTNIDTGLILKCEPSVCQEPRLQQASNCDAGLILKCEPSVRQEPCLQQASNYDAGLILKCEPSSVRQEPQSQGASTFDSDFILEYEKSNYGHKEVSGQQNSVNTKNKPSSKTEGAKLNPELFSINHGRNEAVSSGIKASDWVVRVKQEPPDILEEQDEFMYEASADIDIENVLHKSREIMGAGVRVKVEDDLMETSEDWQMQLKKETPELSEKNKPLPETREDIPVQNAVSVKEEPVSAEVQIKVEDDLMETTEDWLVNVKKETQEQVKVKKEFMSETFSGIDMQNALKGNGSHTYQQQLPMNMLPPLSIEQNKSMCNQQSDRSEGICKELQAPSHVPNQHESLQLPEHCDDHLRKPPPQLPSHRPKQLEDLRLPENHNDYRRETPSEIPSHASNQLDLRLPENHNDYRRETPSEVPSHAPNQLEDLRLPENHNDYRRETPSEVPSHAPNQLEDLRLPENHNDYHKETPSEVPSHAPDQLEGLRLPEHHDSFLREPSLQMSSPLGENKVPDSPSDKSGSSSSTSKDLNQCTPDSGNDDVASNGTSENYDDEMANLALAIEEILKESNDVSKQSLPQEGLSKEGKESQVAVKDKKKIKDEKKSSKSHSVKDVQKKATKPEDSGNGKESKKSHRKSDKKSSHEKSSSVHSSSSKKPGHESSKSSKTKERDKKKSQGEDVPVPEKHAAKSKKSKNSKLTGNTVVQSSQSIAGKEVKSETATQIVSKNLEKTRHSEKREKVKTPSEPIAEENHTAGSKASKSSSSHESLHHSKHLDVDSAKTAKKHAIDSHVKSKSLTDKSVTHNECNEHRSKELGFSSLKHEEQASSFSGKNEVEKKILENGTAKLVKGERFDISQKKPEPNLPTGKLEQRDKEELEREKKKEFADLIAAGRELIKKLYQVEPALRALTPLALLTIQIQTLLEATVAGVVTPKCLIKWVQKGQEKLSLQEKKLALELHQKDRSQKHHVDPRLVVKREAQRSLPQILLPKSEIKDPLLKSEIKNPLPKKIPMEGLTETFPSVSLGKRSMEGQAETFPAMYSRKMSMEGQMETFPTMYPRKMSMEGQTETFPTMYPRKRSIEELTETSPTLCLKKVKREPEDTVSVPMSSTMSAAGHPWLYTPSPPLIFTPPPPPNPPPPPPPPPPEEAACKPRRNRWDERNASPFPAPPLPTVSSADRMGMFTHSKQPPHPVASPSWLPSQPPLPPPDSQDSRFVAEWMSDTESVADSSCSDTSYMDEQLMASTTMIGTRQCKMFKMMHDEQLFTCPYNNSHHVLGAKMATHLVKCRRSHPCEEMGICRYDSTHHVPAPELAYHESSCMASKIIVPDILELNGSSQLTDFTRYKPSPNTSVDQVIQASGECWDDDTPVSGPLTYDPQTKLENGTYMCVPQGKTKAERKAHRRKEFEKYWREKDNGSPTSSEPVVETAQEADKLEEPPAGQRPKKDHQMPFSRTELQEVTGRMAGIGVRRASRGHGKEVESGVGLGRGMATGVGRGISVGHPSMQTAPGLEESQKVVDMVKGRGIHKKNAQ